MNWKGPDELRPLLLPIDDVTKHPRNARRGDVALIMDSIERFGQTKPVVLHTYEGEDGPWIVAGNHTRDAAVAAGWTHIAVTTPELTDDEAEQYLYADNHSSDQSTYDDATLLGGLSELQQRGMLDGTGYSDDELASMIQDANERSEAGMAAALLDHGDGSGGDSAPAPAEGGDLKSLILSLSPEAYATLSKRLQVLQKEYGTADMGATIAQAMEAEFERAWATSQRKVVVPEHADDVPATPKRPKTKAGELIELGPHRLLCGDSSKLADLETLTGGELAAMVLGDPPYGVKYTGGWRKDRTDAFADTFKDEGAHTEWLRMVLANAATVSDDKAALHLWLASREILLVYTALQGSGWTDRTLIVWNKLKAHYGALGAQYKQRNELLVYGHKAGKSPRWHGPKNEPTVWDIDQPRLNELHPTQKPVELYQRSLLNHTASGDAVLELFGGSGSALIAAEITGRRAFVMERDRAYCDVIRQRYADFVAEQLTAATNE